MPTPDNALFDEDAYLACNPDVRQAVAAGQFSSGLDHFMKFGQRENRPGVAVDPAGGDATRYPPEHLRFRVHGARDLDDYLRLGRVISGDVDRLLAAQSVTVPPAAMVLDFGCGPGRVATWLKQRHADWRIFGTDIDAEAIAWAQAHLADVATFECNAPMPPLRYPDGHFDFVYSISIFTHLPQKMQDAWLGELARVTRKGCCLALTTHAEDLLGPSAKKMPAEGFFYARGRRTQGLPRFYQNSFQTSDYVRRVWSRYFSIEQVIPRGVAGHQDLVVCRARDRSGSE